MKLTINWNIQQYECEWFNVNEASSTTYNCPTPSDTSPAPTSSYITHYLKIESLTTTAIEFDSIIITDGNSDTYTIDDFCIRYVFIYDLIFVNIHHLY